MEVVDIQLAFESTALMAVGKSSAVAQLELDGQRYDAASG